MITLKSPIELKTRTDFVHDNLAFEERIAGNYDLMGLEIGPEELLHIVSQPPEIYLAEGGATTIVGNTLIASHNEEKLDIINNMPEDFCVCGLQAHSNKDRRVGGCASYLSGQGIYHRCSVQAWDKR